MAYTQLSRTTVVPGAWQDISDEQNDAQTAAIYDIIGKYGGNVLTVGFSPSQSNLVSVIDYPDELSAQRSVAGILALGTLEFQSIEHLWDVVVGRHGPRGRPGRLSGGRYPPSNSGGNPRPIEITRASHGVRHDGDLAFRILG